MAKKKTHWKAILATLLFAVTVYTGAYYHKQIVRYGYKAYRYYRRHTHPVPTGRYEAIHFPDGYGIHGIDVSHHQTDVNWEKPLSINTDGDTITFTFAIMKATQGLWSEDVAFDGNWEDAHDQHLICGAYHYFMADKDAAAQAKNFISSVNLQKGDLPPVIDIEETRGMAKQELVKAVRTMADILELKYGVKPIIYSNISFIEDYLSDDFEDYYFWVAHYYQDELEISDEIRWVFWQHSDKAMLIGNGQRIDANVFNGTMDELRMIVIH